MHWTPRWHHVSQWGSSGNAASGGNNCAEASIARAILEYNPHTPARAADARWDLVRRIHNPADPARVLDLMDAVSMIARGDHLAGNLAITDVDGIQRALTAYGLAFRVLYSSWQGPASVLAAVQASALAVLWVDGSALAPTHYSGNFFAGEGGFDHIILSLPDGNLCNDPLSDLPDRATDVRYDWTALGQALGGAWLLPSPLDAPVTRHALVPCAGKPQPNHICARVADIAAGELLYPTGQETPHWTQVHVTTADGTLCWLLTSALGA